MTRCTHHWMRFRPRRRAYPWRCSFPRTTRTGSVEVHHSSLPMAGSCNAPGEGDNLCCPTYYLHSRLIIMGRRRAMYLDYQLEPEVGDSAALQGLAQAYARICNRMADYARELQSCSDQTLHSFVRDHPELFVDLAAHFATLAVPRVLRELRKSPEKQFTGGDVVDLDERLVSVRAASPDIGRIPRLYLHLSVGGGGRILVPFTCYVVHAVEFGEGRRVILRREASGWHIYAKRQDA